MKVKWIAILGTLLIFIGMGLVFGGSVWYTRIAVQHECNALTLLLSEPAPKPSNPTANPSRVFAYNFHQDIMEWARADGC